MGDGERPDKPDAPGPRPKSRVPVHSDRGSRFTSVEWASSPKHHDRRPSMIRRGDCHDDAVAESGFDRLDRERIRRKVYRTRDEARRDGFDHPEMFHNPTQKHARNGIPAPIEFERQHKANPEGVWNARGDPHSDGNDFGRRPKTLEGLTPHEFICEQRSSEPGRFVVDPIHRMSGPNTRATERSSRLACALGQKARRLLPTPVGPVSRTLSHARIPSQAVRRGNRPRSRPRAARKSTSSTMDSWRGWAARGGLRSAAVVAASPPARAGGSADRRARAPRLRVGWTGLGSPRPCHASRFRRADRRRHGST